mgnify:CR=1 FL=1
MTPERCAVVTETCAGALPPVVVAIYPPGHPERRRRCSMRCQRKADNHLLRWRPPGAPYAVGNLWREDGASLERDVCWDVSSKRD